MARRRITKRLVDALQATNRDYIIWDSELPGFGVRVRPSGSKSYIVQYRAGRGRKAPSRRITIAAPSKLTPDQARGFAKGIIGDVARNDDPAADRTRKRREMTIREVAALYLADHVKAHNKPSWASEIDSILNSRILPAFGTKRIGDLNRADIKRWHSRMAASPYRANRCLAVLRKMLSLAQREWELRPDNPAIGVKPFPEERRERFFGPEELKAIGRWLAKVERDGSEHRAFILATRLMLLTGMRLGEVATAAWSDVDMSANLIRLRDAKSGARAVPLNSQAVAFLANAQRRGTYVCGLNAGNDVMTRFDYHAFWRRLTKAIGLANARPHDCRHTVATLGAMAGGTAFTLRDLLGHKTIAVTAGYVARTVDPVRALSEDVGGRIWAALASEPEPSPDIVSLRSAANQYSEGVQAVTRDKPDTAERGARRDYRGADTLAMPPSVHVTPSSDLQLARMLLHGFVEDHQGGLRRKYFEKGSAMELEAQTATARLLRRKAPLDNQVREHLADLLDPSAAWQQRKIEFRSRRQGQQTDHIRNSQIASYVWNKASGGSKVTDAIDEAAGKFAISSDRVKQIWEKYLKNRELLALGAPAYLG